MLSEFVLFYILIIIQYPPFSNVNINETGKLTEVKILRIVCKLPYKKYSKTFYIWLLYTQLLENGDRVVEMHSYFVPVRISVDRVFGSQSNTAGSDHKKDWHLEITKIDNVVAGPADPVEEMRNRESERWSKNIFIKYRIQLWLHKHPALRVVGFEDEHADRWRGFGRIWGFLFFFLWLWGLHVFTIT